MSHYVVGVIIDSIEDVEKSVEEVLEPYNENISVEPYIDRTVKQIIEDEKEYLDKFLEYKKNGLELSDYQKNFIEKYQGKSDAEIYAIWRQNYEDGNFDNEGNLLTTYNPKSKWDWWVIGGRWNDYYAKGNILQIKDFILYSDLSEEQYNRIVKKWKSITGEITLTEEEEKDLFGFRLWTNEYCLKRYKTFDNYIKEMTSNMPYSIVDKNGWYTKGDMGWFGCDDATAESASDFRNFAEEYFRAEENQEKYIVFVDCHI